MLFRSEAGRARVPRKPDSRCCQQPSPAPPDARREPPRRPYLSPSQGSAVPKSQFPTGGAAQKRIGDTRVGTSDNQRNIDPTEREKPDLHVRIPSSTTVHATPIDFVHKILPKFLEWHITFPANRGQGPKKTRDPRITAFCERFVTGCDARGWKLC